MADAASLAFQNTWAMDAASNLSETIDRSRPVPRVCRRTGPARPASSSNYAGPGPQHLVCCRWCCRPIRACQGCLHGLALYSQHLHTHVRAWMGITNLGGGEDTASDRVRHASHRVQLAPTCITRPRLPGCFACPHGSVVNQRPPSFNGLAGWAVGAHASAFQA